MANNAVTTPMNVYVSWCTRLFIDWGMFYDA